MHFISFDAAWQLAQDHRDALLQDAAAARARRVQRRARPRPPVDRLLADDRRSGRR